MATTKKLPEILTEEERTAILNVPNKRYPTGLRNKAIMYVMLDAGLRCSEVVGKEKRKYLEGGLRLNHVDWNSGKMKITNGKGGNDRFVWLNETALQAVIDWLGKRPAGETDLVFTTLKGTRIENRYIGYMIKRYAKRAGIQKNVHPHTLRHTFGTDIYRETKNLRMTQKALGHVHISTTEIYTHIVDDELEEGMKNFRNGGRK